MAFSHVDRKHAARGSLFLLTLFKFGPHIALTVDKDTLRRSALQFKLYKPPTETSLENCQEA